MVFAESLFEEKSNLIVDLEVSPLKKRIAVVTLIVSGILSWWAIHLYLNSPDRIMREIVATCNERSRWEGLFNRIDPDDLKRNKWTPERFAEFLGAVSPAGTKGAILRCTEAMPPPGIASALSPPAVTWSRDNVRHYVLSAQPAGSQDWKPVFTLRLRRHLDGRWYFLSGELIVTMAKSDDPSSAEKTERFLRAFDLTSMEEIWMVRPDLRLQKSQFLAIQNGSQRGPAYFAPMQT